MKTQIYIVTVEMPDRDNISADWLKDLIQSDCDAESFCRQNVSVVEVEEPQGLDEAAEEYESYFDVGDEQGYLCTHKGDIKNAVKFGATWMAEQGYKQTERVFNYNGENMPCVSPVIFLPNEFQIGDKVIIQIRQK